MYFHSIPLARIYSLSSVLYLLSTFTGLTLCLFDIIHEAPFDDPFSFPAYSLDMFAPPIHVNDLRDIPKNEILMGPSGARFWCPVSRPSNLAAKNATVGKPLESDELIIEQVTKALTPLSRGKCLSVEQGWWRYDYCHDRHVVQVHEYGKDQQPAVFLLGRGDYADKAHVHTSQGKRYVSIRYRNGEPCGENGKQRTVEIQYHCPDNYHHLMNQVGTKYHEDKISMVQETALCTYSVKMTSTRVCKIAGLSKPVGLLPVVQPCHLIQERTNVPARNAWVPDNPKVDSSLLRHHLGPLSNWAFWTAGGEEVDQGVRELFPLDPAHIGMGDLVMNRPALRGMTKNPYYTSSVHKSDQYRLLQNEPAADDEKSEILSIVRQLVEQYAESDTSEIKKKKGSAQEDEKSNTGKGRDGPTEMYVVTEDGEVVVV